MASFGTCFLFLLASAALPGQNTDVWAPLRVLEGNWAGESDGKPGKGTSTREYRFEMNGRYIMGRTVAKYEKETHEDRGIFSYDRRARTFVLRQFHAEGFVNEYTLVSQPDEGRTLVVETRAIENIPPGWRAREIYRILGPDEMIEEFSLAEPGKEFEVYSTAKLRRVKP